MHNSIRKDMLTKKALSAPQIPEGPLFAIGEMAKRCATTPKTLKHYEKLGLFKPAKVCRETGYRYYSEDQINYFVVIQGMRINNFSLDEIKAFLSTPSPEYLLDSYNKKINSILTEIEQLETTKKRLELRRNLICQALKLKEKSSVPKDFTIKTYPERTLLTTACQGKINAAVIGSAFAENINYSKAQNWGIFEHLLLLYPPVTNWEAPDFHYEAANIISPISKLTSNRIKLLPAGDYVCFYHHGKLEATANTLVRLKNSLRERNLRIEGPLIVFYLISYAHTLSYSNNSCELQYKVSPL